MADADRLAACWRAQPVRPAARRGARRALARRRPEGRHAHGPPSPRAGRVRGACRAPKSRSGARTLPLDDAVAAGLRALKARQAAERLAAGPAYERTGYVAADELGRPVHPEWFTDEFHRVGDRAEVRRIRLHESRHTTCSLMEKAGVPASIIAAWAGHYSAAFTMATYVHANPEDSPLAATRWPRSTGRRGCEIGSRAILVQFPAPAGLCGRHRTRIVPGQGWRARRDSNPQPSDP